MPGVCFVNLFLVARRGHLTDQAELAALIWLCYSQRGGTLIVEVTYANL